MSAPLIALIPLRAGSKGLPGKNIRLLAGKPLYLHTVEQARAAGIQRVIITTDIEELIATDLGQDVSVARRPTALAGDTTTMAEVLRHALTHDIDGLATIVLLQATSPLRDPADIRRTPIIFSFLIIEDVLMGHGCINHVAACGVQNALGLAG